MMFQRIPNATNPRELASRPDMGTPDDVLRYLLERLAALEDRVAGGHRTELPVVGRDLTAAVRIKSRQILSARIGEFKSPHDLAERLTESFVNQPWSLSNPPKPDIYALRAAGASLLADAIDDPPAGCDQVSPPRAAAWARDQAAKLRRVGEVSPSLRASLEARLWDDAADILEYINKTGDPR